MEDELDDFINFDTVFIDSPGFNTNLIALACTMGETVDEALSMSGVVKRWCCVVVPVFGVAGIASLFMWDVVANVC